MLLLWLAGLLVVLAATGALLASRNRNQSIGLAALFALGGAVPLLALPRITGHLTAPERAFRQAFGVPPPIGFAGLRARADPGFGFTNLFVGFDAAPVARAWLNARLGTVPRVAESNLAARLANGGDTPDWWRGAPAMAKRGQCEERQADELQAWNGWRTVVVVECRSDGRFYLLFSRVD